jgi:two-component system sensor histidine kinase KdpD
MVVGHPVEENWVGLIAGPDFVRREIIDEIAPLLDRYRAELLLLDEKGGRSAGTSVSLPESPSQPVARRTVAETGLPWTLHVYSSDLDEDLALLAGRRRLVAVGLVLMTALVVAGGVLSAQSVRRELRVADLKSSLVAAVSHEFRTPLTLLRQTTEALADGRVSDAPTQHRYYYRQLRATDRLQRLVEGMLDFARLEAGAFELSAEAFNAGDWVAAVTEAFNSEVEGNVAQVRLEATVPDVDIHADREALTRVLWNLMDNAVKHSPAGTPVNVRVLQEADGMAVEVRDRGPGVDPGERDAIFDRFARGRQAAGRAQGTGLGLALAREIARAHGGDVTVRGRPGGGSIFTLSLPLGGHG